jgi:hypothetical protein
MEGVTAVKWTTNTTRIGKSINAVQHIALWIPYCLTAKCIDDVFAPERWAAEAAEVFVHLTRQSRSLAFACLIACLSGGPNLITLAPIKFVRSTSYVVAIYTPSAFPKSPCLPQRGWHSITGTCTPYLSSL